MICDGEVSNLMLEACLQVQMHTLWGALLLEEVQCSPHRDALPQVCSVNAIHTVLYPQLLVTGGFKCESRA